MVAFMKMFEKWINSIFGFFSSIRLAVIVILALAILSAAGTIVESNFDAEVAQKLIYKSIYMYFIMGLLCANLIAVMIDRWPWKRRHVAFLLAHVGIITTLVGSVQTQWTGVDGSISFGIGEKNRWVMVPEHQFIVAASFGEGMTTLYKETVDFFMSPPQTNPLTVSLDKDELQVKNYIHYGLRDSKVRPSKLAQHGPALRFQLQNDNINMSRWMIQKGIRPEVMELGPARVVLTAGDYKPTGENEIILSRGVGEKIHFKIFSKRLHKVTSEGEMSESEVVETGWMGIQLRLLRYYPQAQESISYSAADGPTPITEPAVQFSFKDNDYWVGLNRIIRLYQDDRVYIVRFGNKLLDLGFDMELKKFEVKHYQGTRKAMTYASEVEIPDLGLQTISMNEPLKYNGFTFYQASFEQDESGEPVSSILSVNRDPGRPLKYLGSLLIVVGALMLFYFKKWGLKKPKASRG